MPGLQFLFFLSTSRLTMASDGSSGHGMVHLLPRVQISSAFWPHTPYTHQHVHPGHRPGLLVAGISFMLQILIQKSYSLQNLFHNTSPKLSHLRGLQATQVPTILFPDSKSPFFTTPTYPARSHRGSVTSMTLCPL